MITKSLFFYKFLFIFNKYLKKLKKVLFYYKYKIYTSTVLIKNFKATNLLYGSSFGLSICFFTAIHIPS